MSKIYDRYLNLKEKDNDKIYLFECGNFYIMLDSDAIICNEIFGFKLTKFSNLCDKCGFPLNSLDKYIIKFKERELNYEIIKNEIKSEKNKLDEIKELINNSNYNELNNDDLVDIIRNIYDIIME